MQSDTRLLLLALLVAAATACTNILVTPGASADGSAFLSYNADSSSMMGTLRYEPHAKWAPNTTVDVYEWDTGKYLGKIAQVAETYTVVGNMNEHQLAITETTFGGLDALQHQPKAVIDYGSLIYITLARARTAREAVAVMADLVQRYGYYSEGESFSIADPNEVWYMEMIGKGEFELGAVWVALRVPDGYVASHANQARIRTFPLSDSESCVYSADVISFAREHGFYSGSDEEFSFSDTYHPMTFRKARTCEARVWSVFRHVAGAEAMDPYLDYVQGKDLTHRMPLWVRPKSPVSLNDTMSMMRDHYEGTALDFTTDVGAEAFGAPYRRTLLFDYGGRSYVHERAIAVVQTGFAIVTQSRAWLPREIGGVLWFAVDDAACAVYFPVYTSVTRVPTTWTGGDIASADFNKAWWAFQVVANFVYPRWSLVYPSVFAKIQEYEARYFAEVRTVEAKAAVLYAQSPQSAAEYLTAYTEKTGNALVFEWFGFFKALFAKYRDIYVTERVPGQARPSITSPGYSEAWRARIVADAGDRYIMPLAEKEDPQNLPKYMI